MDLDAQIDDLIENAPQDGTTPQLMARIAPALKALAERLRHEQYYILQTLEQGWIVVTMRHNYEPATEKHVIYAFPTLKDVSAGPYTLDDPALLAIPVPVTHILFQLFALADTDSAIFFETPGNTTIGTEIRRSEVEALVQAEFMSSTEVPTRPEIPSDIA